MTPGVQALYQTQAIAARVQAYDDFNERNDPYGEHDFGSFEFCGETIFWKIEYYDLDHPSHIGNRLYASEDAPRRSEHRSRCGGGC